MNVLAMAMAPFFLVGPLRECDLPLLLANLSRNLSQPRVGVLFTAEPPLAKHRWFSTILLRTGYPKHLACGIYLFLNDPFPNIFCASSGKNMIKPFPKKRVSALVSDVVSDPGGCALNQTLPQLFFESVYIILSSWFLLSWPSPPSSSS